MRSYSLYLLLSCILIFSSCSWFYDISPTKNGLQNRQSYKGKIHSFDLIIPDKNAELIPVIIMGGGVAGLTAALYCAQAGLPSLIIEGPKPGGALAQSASVRNWPGVKEQPGRIIVHDLKEQVLSLGVAIKQEIVTDINLSCWPYSLTCQNLLSQEIYSRQALAVIVAMGTEPNYLGVPGEQEYWGRGVSNCAVCDGALCVGKDVVIVGGGDAAFAEASYLASIAKTVTILVRSDRLRAKDSKMVKRVLGLPNVMLFYESRVSEIRGEGNRLTELVLERLAHDSEAQVGRVKNSNTHKEGQKKENGREILPIDALFLAIGSRPNTALFKRALVASGLLESFLDHDGFIRLYNEQESFLPGLFAAGDICDKEFVQAVTAAGQGCKAALQAKRFLERINFDQERFVRDFSEPHILLNDQLSMERSEKQGLPIPEIETREELENIFMTEKKPLLFDFYAEYCLECQQLEQLLQKHSGELAQRVSLYTIAVTHEVLRNFLIDRGMPEILSVPQLVLYYKNKFILIDQEQAQVGKLLPALDQILDSLS